MTPSADLWPSAWRTVSALAVVLSLLGGAIWLLRRTLVTRQPRRGLHVEAALALGERRSLAIVKVEGRRLLLGLTPGQVSLVTELTPAAFDQAVDRAAEPGGPS